MNDYENGCSDGSCILMRPTGMHTNGGCQCLKALPPRLRRKFHFHIYRLRRERKEAEAEVERLRKSDAYWKEQYELAEGELKAYLETPGNEAQKERDEQHTALAARYVALLGRAARLEAEVERLRDERDRLVMDLASAKEDYDDGEADHTAARAEAERLREVLRLIADCPRGAEATLPLAAQAALAEMGDE